MIDPTDADIGRAVLYRDAGQAYDGERGVITSFNQHYVFVRYGAGDGAKATSRSDLEWAEDAA